MQLAYLVTLMGFLVVGGTVLGFGAYTWLLRVTSAAAVSTYAFVNPVVALLLAWAVGDGELSARTALAAALVIGAVVFTREPTGPHVTLNEVKGTIPAWPPSLRSG